jgi:cyclopropane-fatty-acyl-phospholipid synthase
VRLFDALLRRLVRKGSLTVIDADGGRHAYGDGSGEPVTIRFTDTATPRRAAFNPALELGEAYMDERLLVEKGDIAAFLGLIGRNTHWDDDDAVRLSLWRPWRRSQRWETWNWKRQARRNVAHHYDLSNRLFALFLDADLQYSCGYFPDPAMTLDEAQRTKKAHIAAKLNLRPGQRVLDIGCGWGGLALYLHEVAGVDVLGITLSEDQLAVARQRAAAAGGGRPRALRALRLPRCRGVVRPDRIGGHVRACRSAQLPGLLQTLPRPARADGVMLLHTIGRADGPAPTDRWLARYIFPGGYVPALSQIAPAIEDARLWITDIEVLRIHYAQTLAHWNDNVVAARDEIEALHDARFYRMWQFYLAGAMVAFRHDAHLNLQIQLARRREALPLTRDYMAEAERALVSRATPPGPAGAR